VKRTHILAGLLIAFSLLSSSCGTGDKIGSVSVTAIGVSGGFVNIVGLGGTIQLKVTANYTSGKQIDETNFATYEVTAQGYDNNFGPIAGALQAPPNTLTINNTGMVTSVDPAVCTWVSTTGDPKTPGWAYTGDYMIVAHYRGFSSQPIFIPISSAASAQSGMQGQCGPTS